MDTKTLGECPLVLRSHRIVIVLTLCVPQLFGVIMEQNEWMNIDCVFDWYYDLERQINMYNIECILNNGLIFKVQLVDRLFRNAKSRRVIKKCNGVN